MYVIKDVINNVYFEKINNMNNIESGLSYFKTYSSLEKAKTDLKIIRQKIRAIIMVRKVR